MSDCLIITSGNIFVNGQAALLFELIHFLWHLVFCADLRTHSKLYVCYVLSNDAGLTFLYGGPQHFAFPKYVPCWSTLLDNLTTAPFSYSWYFHFQRSTAHLSIYQYGPGRVYRRNNMRNKLSAQSFHRHHTEIRHYEWLKVHWFGDQRGF